MRLIVLKSVLRTVSDPYAPAARRLLCSTRSSFPFPPSSFRRRPQSHLSYPSPARISTDDRATTSASQVSAVPRRPQVRKSQVRT